MNLGDAKATALMFTALADATRVRVLATLAENPDGLNVSQLATAVEVPMVNMSHHVTKLLAAGCVDVEAAGRTRVYTLKPQVYAKGVLLAGALKVTGLNGKK
jgi:DNA-binding transcriptional ArsR family regulator